MPLPFAPGCLKARISGVQGGGEFGMIFHYRQPTGGNITDADATNFANGIFTAYTADVAPFMPSTTKLTSVVVEGLNSAVDGVGAKGGSSSGGGGAGAAAQVCVLEKDLVALRYRGGHPRHYWPAPQDAIMASPTTIDPAGLTILESNVDTFHNGVIADGVALWGAGFEYGAVSYFTGHALRPSPLFMPILGWSLESTVATQRRRIGR